MVAFILQAPRIGSLNVQVAFLACSSEQRLQGEGSFRSPVEEHVEFLTVACVCCNSLCAYLQGLPRRFSRFSEGLMNDRAERHPNFGCQTSVLVDLRFSSNSCCLPWMEGCVFAEHDVGSK